MEDDNPLPRGVLGRQKRALKVANKLGLPDEHLILTGSGLN